MVYHFFGVQWKKNMGKSMAKVQQIDDQLPVDCFGLPRHAGFAMLETGCCRAKNASNVLMKNLVNVCAGTLGWWSFGWAFAYGSPATNGFIGWHGFFGFDMYTYDSRTGNITPVDCQYEGSCQSQMLSWFFQWAFCTAAATIVSGAVAERVKSPTYAVFAFFMTSFIYPVVVAWTWGGGWISTLFDVGVMDFAGSGNLM
jgi:Amt family ammonium transporter